MLPILLRQETIPLKHEVKKLLRKKPGSLIYQKLITAKSLTPRKSQLKWFQDCNFSDEEDTFNWELAYLMAQRCTKSTKLIEFKLNYYIGAYQPMISYLKQDENKMTTVPFATIPQRR